jgi:hypothetical protein
MHVTRSLWISQLSYIEKIAHQFTPVLQRCPKTPMSEEELLPLPLEEEVNDTGRTLYQRKVGSLLFAGIATCDGKTLTSQPTTWKTPS